MSSEFIILGGACLFSGLLPWSGSHTLGRFGQALFDATLITSGAMLLAWGAHNG